MILFGKSDATKRLKLTNQLKSGLIVYVTSLSLLKATTAAKLNVVSSVYILHKDPKIAEHGKVRFLKFNLNSTTLQEPLHTAVVKHAVLHFHAYLVF